MLIKIAVLLLITNLVYAALPNSADEFYLKRRDALIQYLTQKADAEDYEKFKVQETESLKALEGILKSYIPNIKIDGFEPSGRINLETLVKNDYGFGLLDGIEYRTKDGDEMIVTSRKLFENYILNDPSIPDDVRLAFDSDELLVDPSAYATFLGKIPIISNSTELVVSAHLYNAGQESNIYGAGMLFVAVASSEIVVIVTKRLKQPLPEYLPCKNIINHYEKKYEEIEGNNETARNSRSAIYNLGESKYIDCQMKYSNSSKEYRAAENDAQNIVKDIEEEILKLY